MYHGTTMVDARSTIVKHSSTMVHHSILWYYYGIPHCTVVYHGSTMVFFEQGTPLTKFLKGAVICRPNMIDAHSRKHAFSDPMRSFEAVRCVGRPTSGPCSSRQLVPKLWTGHSTGGSNAHRPYLSVVTRGTQRGRRRWMNVGAARLL